MRKFAIFCALKGWYMYALLYYTVQHTCTLYHTAYIIHMYMYMYNVYMYMYIVYIHVPCMRTHMYNTMCLGSIIALE